MIRLFNSDKEIPLEFFNFPGGEIHLNPDSIRSSSWGGDLWIDARIKSFEDIGRLWLLKNSIIKIFKEDNVRLFCPYLPGARQDRGIPQTAFIYADQLNLLFFREVYGVDPHSDVMPSLIRRYQNISLCKVVEKFKSLDINQFDGLIAPDQGAIKRVEELGGKFNKFSTKIFYARKKREFSTGKLSGFSCELLENKDGHYLIVDDICDGGGTFNGLAQVIKQQQPNVKLSLLVTHGIFSKGLDELLSNYEQIYTTDSWLPTIRHPKLTIFKLEIKNLIYD